MKLKIFDEENCRPSAKEHSPFISINTKGHFWFNVQACELLKIGEHDNVIFLQDEEDLLNWYVQKTDGRGFEIKRNDLKKTGLMFRNASLAKKIFRSLEHTDGTIRIAVSEKPTIHQGETFHGLIQTSIS